MSYQQRDAYYRKAKKEGYRSRAAYKLLELNRRFNIIKPGDRVVDLGAAPGGWLQVASELTGKRGRVIGVDLQPIEPLHETNILFLQGDITSKDSQTKVMELLCCPADCVLSDLSPQLTGIHHADVSRSVEVARAALRMACALLKPKGCFLVKAFMGEETAAFVAELKRHFASIRRTRPEATRKGSSEIYLIARGFRELPRVTNRNKS
ncbi:MAG: RlmE family RNA methyltransferase [Candidatus Binatia bacterium]